MSRKVSVKVTLVHNQGILEMVEDRANLWGHVEGINQDDNVIAGLSDLVQKTHERIEVTGFVADANGKG